MILIVHKEGVQRELTEVRKIVDSFSENALIQTENLDQIEKKDLSQYGIIIILGGDGATLKTLFNSSYKGGYVLSINAGKVGFIASVGMNEARSILQSYFSKNYEEIRMDRRFWLLTTMHGKKYHSLNEVSVYRGSSSRMLHIKASFNGVQTLGFRADGLIVSTSTGSTAYNLSAGGPIVHPEIPAIIFNPICPYSLTLKPIVIPQSDRIAVEAEFQGKDAELEVFNVTFDGQTQISCSGQTTLEFCLSDSSVCFMKPKGEHYYTTLKKKIYWGQGLL